MTSLLTFESHLWLAAQKPLKPQRESDAKRRDRIGRKIEGSQGWLRGPRKTAAFKPTRDREVYAGDAVVYALDRH